MHIDSRHRPTGHAIHRLAASLSERTRRRRERRSFRRLLSLDDHMLGDLGVERHQVERAARMPLSVDAATELGRLSLEGRRHRF